MDRVRRGQLVGMIAIPKGFGETAGMMWMEAPAIEVGIDPSRKAEAGMLQGNDHAGDGQADVRPVSGPGQHAAVHREGASRKSPTATTLPALMRPALAQMMDSLDALSESWAERAGRGKGCGRTRAASNDARVSARQHRNDRRHAQSPQRQHRRAAAATALEVGHQLSAGDDVGRAGLRGRLRDHDRARTKARHIPAAAGRAGHARRRSWPARRRPASSP